MLAEGTGYGVITVEYGEPYERTFETRHRTRPCMKATWRSLQNVSTYPKSIPVYLLHIFSTVSFP